MSPALAGRFFTTNTPRKPDLGFFSHSKNVLPVLLTLHPGYAQNSSWPSGSVLWGPFTFLLEKLHQELAHPCPWLLCVSCSSDPEAIFPSVPYLDGSELGCKGLNPSILFQTQRRGMVWFCPLTWRLPSRAPGDCGSLNHKNQYLSFCPPLSWAVRPHQTDPPHFSRGFLTL